MDDSSTKNMTYTEYGYRGLEELQLLKQKNQILSANVYDLQKQLQEAHKRIKELIEEFDEFRYHG